MFESIATPRLTDDTEQPTSLGRVLWLAAHASGPTAPIQVHDLGLEVRIVLSSLVALGLVADFDPEVLWIDSLDDELTLEEILYALRIPRRIHPIAVVISTDRKSVV